MSKFVLRDVSKTYGDVSALSNINLTVTCGNVHGLMGPNGSGKTTLFHLLSGLTRPTSGHIDRPNALIGVGFQQPRFYPDLTVRENLDVFRSFLETPPSATWTDQLIDELRLTPVLHREGRNLSGGFRTKLDLALALLKRPTFLLLDEPLADVDDHSRAHIVPFLESYASPETSILVSTHNMAAFDSALDRLTVLLDGSIEYDGPADVDALTQYRQAIDDHRTNT